MKRILSIFLISFSAFAAEKPQPNKSAEPPVDPIEYRHVYAPNGKTMASIELKTGKIEYFASKEEVVQRLLLAALGMETENQLLKKQVAELEKYRPLPNKKQK